MRPSVRVTQPGTSPVKRQISGQDGFTLVEAIIVLTLLAMAIVPLANTQFSSRRVITRADRQTQALQIAVGEVERARMGGFGAAVQDTMQTGDYEIFTQVVPDSASLFLEEVQIVVNWESVAGPQSLTMSTKRASR